MGSADGSHIAITQATAETLRGPLHPERGLVLTVGLAEAPQTIQNLFPSNTSLISIDFSKLSRGLIHKLQPLSVVVPAFGEEFCCYDIAEMLHDVRYNGEMQIVAGGLALPELVRSDLSRDFKHLTFSVFRPTITVTPKKIH